MLYTAPNADISTVQRISSIAMIDHWTVVYCRNFKVSLLKQGLLVPSEDVHNKSVKVHQFVWIGRQRGDLEAFVSKQGLSLMFILRSLHSNCAISEVWSQASVNE